MLCPLRLDIDPLPTNAEPWLIDEALVKKHCRIDFGDDDNNLQLYVAAAIEWVENETHRSIIEREHRWTLKAFPADGIRQQIRLPRGRTTAVLSVVYSLAGELITLRGSDSSPAGLDYQEDLSGDSGGVLMPPRGNVWPAVDCDVPAPVTITFNAGWAPSEIPTSLFHAILLTISDIYELRGSADYSTAGLLGSGRGDRLIARETLASGYRLPRDY